MIVSKTFTRNANGWDTQQGNLIPNGVKCNKTVMDSSTTVNHDYL